MHQEKAHGQPIQWHHVGAEHGPPVVADPLSNIEDDVPEAPDLPDSADAELLGVGSLPLSYLQ